MSSYSLLALRERDVALHNSLRKEDLGYSDDRLLPAANSKAQKGMLRKVSAEISEFPRGLTCHGAC